MASARRETIVVRNYREFIRSLGEVDKKTQRQIRADIRQVGNIVRDDARQKFDQYSPTSAAGYRTVVRQRGVSVEQSLRKTTGRGSEWGRLQMKKALYPALKDNSDKLVVQLNRALDEIAGRF